MHRSGLSFHIYARRTHIDQAQHRQSRTTTYAVSTPGSPLGRAPDTAYPLRFDNASGALWGGLATYIHFNACARRVSVRSEEITNLVAARNDAGRPLVTAGGAVLAHTPPVVLRCPDAGEVSVTLSVAYLI